MLLQNLPFGFRTPKRGYDRVWMLEGTCTHTLRKRAADLSGRPQRAEYSLFRSGANCATEATLNCSTCPSA